MNNQNQSAVEYLEQFLRRHCNPTVCDIEYSEYKMAFEQAKEMESKKQHKYDEMLDMLNRIRLGELPEEELRQLIKEATILP